MIKLKRIQRRREGSRFDPGRHKSSKNGRTVERKVELLHRTPRSLSTKLALVILVRLALSEIRFVCSLSFSSPEPKAHKVSLLDAHAPSSVRRRPSSVHNFKDLLL